MTIESLSVPLRREDVLHFLGYRGRGTPGPRVEEMLASVLAEARELIAPRGLRRVVPRDAAAALGLKTESGPCLALGLVTIGIELERRVTSLLERGAETRALLLDAAGSAAVEEAAEALESLIHGHVDGSLGRPGRRVSPGYGSWPVTAQRALFDLLPHEEIGVRLLPSCLMAPRKSVSFAVWLAATEGSGPEAGGRGGTAALEPCGPGRCARCDVVTCPYRDESADGESS